MKKKIIWSVVFILISSVSFSQQDFSIILETVKKNNPSIAEALLLKEAYYQESKILNTPDNPEIRFGYFPETKSGDVKKTIGITQKFDFPLVYPAYKKLAKSKQKEYDIEFQKECREILYSAAHTCIELAYYLKSGNEIENRLRIADSLSKAFELRMESGDISVIEYNKTRLQHSLTLSNLSVTNSKIESAINALSQMSNSATGNINELEYPNYTLPEKEEFLMNARNADFSVLEHEAFVERTEIEKKVSKLELFPSLEIGYESEITDQENFRGPVAGISIPVWNSSKKLKYSKLMNEYAVKSMEQNDITLQNKLNNMYLQAEILSDNLQQMRESLASINNERLLSKALKSGELSIIDYYAEIRYYYETVDNLLIIEKEYYLALLELNKFSLSY